MTDMADLMADLTYSNYKFNRERSPHIPPERWAQVFGSSAWVMLEARYQRELTNANNN
jgi:hypothetical protein